MPRYFFHLYNSTGFVFDEEGKVCATFEDARSEAIIGIRSILADEAMAGSINLRGHIDIANERGDVIDTVLFRQAVELKGCAI